MKNPEPILWTWGYLWLLSPPSSLPWIDSIKRDTHAPSYLRDKAFSCHRIWFEQSAKKSNLPPAPECLVVEPVLEGFPAKSVHHCSSLLIKITHIWKGLLWWVGWVEVSKHLVSDLFEIFCIVHHLGVPFVVAPATSEYNLFLVTLYKHEVHCYSLPSHHSHHSHFEQTWGSPSWVQQASSQWPHSRQRGQERVPNSGHAFVLRFSQSKLLCNSQS